MEQVRPSHCQHSEANVNESKLTNKKHNVNEYSTTANTFTAKIKFCCLWAWLNINNTVLIIMRAAKIEENEPASGKVDCHCDK